MSRKRACVSFVAVLVALAWIAAPSAQQPNEQELLKRIAALEAGQQIILKELQELKKLLQQPRVPAQGVPTVQNAPAPSANPGGVPAFDLELAGSPSKGRADAGLVLLEFSDFECPFCGRFTRDTHDLVLKEFVDTGKVRYVFRHFPIEKLHPRALRAHQAAECAHTQGKFWEYHHLLFGDQQALNEPDFTRHARTVGLNLGTFDTCMAAQKASPLKIRQDLNEGARAGITGTPTFFLGTVTSEGKLKVIRRLVGAHPIANFRTAIDAALAQPK